MHAPSTRKVAAVATVAALAAVGAVGASAHVGAKAKKVKVAEISYTIVPGGKKGPDGKQHDAYLGRTSFTVRQGEKVVITVKNTDGGPHSFTSPGLGLNEKFAGNKTTTFSFVAKKAGKFLWFCAQPCDSESHAWAMNPTHLGYMAGEVTVTA